MSRGEEVSDMLDALKKFGTFVTRDVINMKDNDVGSLLSVLYAKNNVSMNFKTYNVNSCRFRAPSFIKPSFICALIAFYGTTQILFLLFYYRF